MLERAAAAFWLLKGLPCGPQRDDVAWGGFRVGAFALRIKVLELEVAKMRVAKHLKISWTIPDGTCK